MSAQSIADRAKAGEGEQGQDELFPIGSLEGDSKSLKNLVRAGLPVKSTVSMRSAEVPSSGGLFDPEREGKVLISWKLDSVETVPERDGERVIGWKIRQVLRPTYVEGVDADAAHIEAAFASLLDSQPKSAASALDRMQKRASGTLRS